MKKTMVRLCFVLACMTLGVVQVGTKAAAQDTTKSITWTRLSGTAVDISINSQGQAYAVAPDGTPWRWDALEQRWRKMSGDFVRITAAEGNRPWAINAGGVVFRYNGLWWENKDTNVVDVAGDALGNVYIAKASGEIKKWNPLRSEWRTLEGTAYRIALDMAGNPWVVTRDRRIRAFDGKGWIEMPGRALDIAIGGDDTKVIADVDGQVRIWNNVQRRWQVVVGVDGVIAVAAAPNGGPWVVVKEGGILATTLLVAPEQIKTEKGKAKEIQAPQAVAPVDSAPVAVASSVAATPATPAAAVASSVQGRPITAPVQMAAKLATPPAVSSPATNVSGQSTSATVTPIASTMGTTDPAAVTAKGNITFINTQKNVSALAIGKDGSVFGLDAGGNVVRWSNARKWFESFPGTLARIAVDPNGNPWGISILGRVFRHDGNLWKQIPIATGSDISIGADGTVVITDASSGLYKLNDAMTRFERIPGQGLLVAVAPDGTPWSIRSDSLVQQCATSPCKVFTQKAKSISIGPDGSVYVVSDRGFLMRLGADSKTFELVRTPGHTPLRVAVGPNGYPWVVSSATLALASTYFQRDEQNDRTIAASTAGDTAGSGSTAAVVDVPSSTSFTFSKSMDFEEYSTGLANHHGIHIGENGKVYLRGTNIDGQLYVQKIRVFNSTKNTFEDTDISFPEEVSSMDAASDGTLWGYKDGSVYKLSATGKLMKTYTVSSDTARSLAVSADGSVYIVAGSLLYRLKPGTSVFTKFSNDDVRKVAVGRAGDLWITDSNSYVQQYTGTKFENRPLGQSVEGTAIGASSNGSVYISVQSGSYPILKKWNATNKSFDTVKNTRADIIDVDPDGRPWIAYSSGDGNVQRGKD